MQKIVKPINQSISWHTNTKLLLNEAWYYFVYKAETKGHSFRIRFYLPKQENNLYILHTINGQFSQHKANHIFTCIRKWTRNYCAAHRWHHRSILWALFIVSATTNFMKMRVRAASMSIFLLPLVLALLLFLLFALLIFWFTKCTKRKCCSRCFL